MVILNQNWHTANEIPSAKHLHGKLENYPFYRCVLSNMVMFNFHQFPCSPWWCNCLPHRDHRTSRLLNGFAIQLWVVECVTVHLAWNSCRQAEHNWSNQIWSRDFFKKNWGLTKMTFDKGQPLLSCLKQQWKVALRFRPSLGDRVRSRWPGLADGHGNVWWLFFVDFFLMANSVDFSWFFMAKLVLYHFYGPISWNTFSVCSFCFAVPVFLQSDVCFRRGCLNGRELVDLPLPTFSNRLRLVTRHALANFSASDWWRTWL